MAHETGLPPKELKNSIPLLNLSAIFFLHITAATGCPLPKDFPIVTISGITPYSSKPQNFSPTLPNPVCISSEIHKPPSFFIIL